MSALNEQPGGNHYKDKAIQPVQYIHDHVRVSRLTR